MAPPPKYLITRKLIKRFFNNYLPKEPLHTTGDSQKLFECWQTHGIDSPKCKDAEAMFDNAMEQGYLYHRRINSMDFKKTILATIRKPVYHKEIKGRYRRKISNEPRDIFDGVE